MTELIHTDFGGEECLGNELVEMTAVLRSLKTWHMLKKLKNMSHDADLLCDCELSCDLT